MKSRIALMFVMIAFLNPMAAMAEEGFSAKAKSEGLPSVDCVGWAANRAKVLTNGVGKTHEIVNGRVKQISEEAI